MRTLLIALLISHLPFLVTAQACEPATAMLEISNENMRVNLLNGGDAFWDFSDGRFIIPDNPAQQVTSVFAGALWIGGFDPGGNLKVAAQTYRQNGNDFFPGPLDHNGNVTQQVCSDFDRIWKVSSYSILSLIDDYEDNNIIDNPIGPSLLSWPAKGNPFFFGEMGFDLPDQDLAPFYDRNNDGIYNPMDGDYPVFEHNDPDAIAWELTWCVFNDAGNIHTNTQGDELGVEVQQSFWTLQCSDNELLNNTLYNKNKIINRSLEALDSVKVGHWVDFDLGCYSDDFIGSIPELNTFYVYNGDNLDEDCQGVLGYGENPPGFSVTYLNHDISTFLFYSSIISPTGIPQTALDYYNYISGSWLDNSLWEWGGDGYNEGTFPYPYFFPDNPNDNSGSVWHEIEQNNTAFDRRGVGSVGPFNMAPGSVIEIVKAYSYHRDDSFSNLENVDLLYNNIPVLQTAFENGFSTSVCTPESICTNDCVWPGDANNNGIVNYLDFLPVGTGFGESGLPRATTSSSWTPKNASDWSLVHPGDLNFKHLDAFGDGTVGEEDAIIVSDNYGSINDFYTGPLGNSDNGSELYITKALPSSTDTLDLGISIFDIYLKPPNGVLDAIYGIGFRLHYPSDEISLIPLLGNGFLINDDFIRYGFDNESAGHFDFAQVMINEQELITGDSILLARIQLEWSTPTPSVCSAEITFDNFLAVDSLGATVPIGKINKTVYHSCVITDVENIEADQFDISIFPNPASSLLNIDFQGNDIELIMIHDALGRHICDNIPLTGMQTIDVSGFAEGLYYISFTWQGQIFTKKFTLIR